MDKSLVSECMEWGEAFKDAILHTNIYSDMSLYSFVLCKDRAGKLCTLDGEYKKHFSERELHSRPCHAFLGYSDYKEKRLEPVAIYTCTLKEEWSKKVGAVEFNRWIEYLMSHSIFGQGYLVEDVDWVKNNCAIFDPELSYNFLNINMIQHRRCCEKSKHGSIKIWNIFVEAGLNPDYAYLLSNIYKEYRKGFSIYNKIGGHEVCDVTILNLKDVKRFFNGELKPNNKPYKTAHVFKGSYATFKVECLKGVNESFDKILTEHVDKTGIRKIENIKTTFGTHRKACYDTKELIEVLKGFYNKHF